YVYSELKNGEVGLLINNKKLLYKNLFPVDKIPYVGIWINEGEFKDGYMVAIEPTNGFYDSVLIAKGYNRLNPILPDSYFDFFVDIELSPVV
ncbi:MAG TPA: hypothetical protein PK771_13235, partial [Spirochaetota bacterium]|nr:hypothetical protein [Spirochaetota bacterium]